MENDLYRSPMSLIITADSDGNAYVGNGLYRSDMTLIIAEIFHGNAGVEMANIDQLYH